MALNTKKTAEPANAEVPQEQQPQAGANAPATGAAGGEAALTAEAARQQLLELNIGAAKADAAWRASQEAQRAADPDGAATFGAAKLVGLLESTDSELIAKIKAPLGGMRKSFTDYHAAFLAFAKAANEAGSTIPCHAVSPSVFVDPETGEPHSDAPQAVVAVVGQRVKDAKEKTISGIKGLVLFAMPQADAFIAGDPAWIAKLVEKEASHIAFRRIRGATSFDDFASGFGEIPSGVPEYVMAYNTGALDVEAFDAIWPSLRATVKVTQPAVYDNMPPKAEVLKAIRSKSYAEAEFPELEALNVFKFLGLSAIRGCIKNKTTDGTPAPIDPSAIVEWMENRDTFQQPTRKVTDISEIKGVDLLAGMQDE
jgi:hypothetical protein